MFGHGSCLSKKRFLYNTATLYACTMSEIEIVQSSYHPNGRAAPFYAAIVDDANTGETKVIVMFDEPDYTAVLSLDTLIDDEDVSNEKHRSRGDLYDDLLRDALWYSEDGTSAY